MAEALPEHKDPTAVMWEPTCELGLDTHFADLAGQSRYTS